MRFLVACLLLLGGCKKKEAAPAASADDEPEAAGRAEPKANNAETTAQEATTPGGSAQDKPVEPGPQGTMVVEGKYGACDVTATGEIFFESHAPNEATAVLTDHWLTAATKAERAKKAADAARTGDSYRAPEVALTITCVDPARGIYIRFAPTMSKLADIAMKPQDFPIKQSPEDKPGVMRAEVKTREASVTPRAGGLHITRFEPGELAATFELDIESFDEPPKKSRLIGKLVYHCADNPHCGTK